MLTTDRENVARYAQCYVTDSTGSQARKSSRLRHSCVTHPACRNSGALVLGCSKALALCMAQVPAAGSNQVPAQAAGMAAEGTDTEGTEAGVEAGAGAAAGKQGTVAAGL
jgi:hypothetical protein